MKHLPIAFLVLLATTLGAYAENVQSFSSNVPSGKKWQVRFFTQLNVDCSSSGEIESRVVKQPANGTVEFETASDYPHYDQKNPRFDCNSKSVPGVKIFYTAKEGFTGKDAFDVEFFGKNGMDVTWKVQVTVK